MRVLTLLTLAAVAAALCAPHAAAQPPTPTHEAPPAAPEAWVEVSPAGEGFSARMPQQPAPAEQRVRADELKASGVRYAAAADERTRFVVWSMKGAHGQVSLAAVNGPAAYHGGEPYLDAVAELAWELLMAPELKRLGREGMSVGRMARLNLGMEYQRGFEVGGRRAREYFVNLERERGPVYVCADGERAYVVAALGAEADDARLKQFVDSFALKAGAASVSAPQGGGEGLGAAPAPRPGGNGGGAAPVASTGGFADRADYSRPFKHTEVTKKAAITAKPEPGFTEQARKFNVTGAVRLRAILNVSGSVQNIVVVKGLPHGLTEKSVAAARQIRFEPAQKDGRAVSQYVVLEYNFNIY